MSEQLGQAAGTAEPEEIPVLDLLKPWQTNPMSRSMVVDAKGGVVAICGNNRRLAEFTDPAAAIITARHIAACVNFCGAMDTDLLEFLASGQFQIRIARISAQDHSVCFAAREKVRATDGDSSSPGPSLRKQLSDAREKFVRDLRNGNAVVRGLLPGGAI